MFCRKTAALLAALALTACASTNAPSVIETVEVPVMPPVPAALLAHAARFGAYVKTLEAQNAAWRQWVSDGLKAEAAR